MQTCNQNVLNSAEIRDLNNVQQKSYQNSNALFDENDIKICDNDEKKEKKNENDENDVEELKYISEKKIDSKI